MSPPTAAPQYQTFPDAPGDSLSLRKLKALRLPVLVGLRFLDIGCNEGFFCGYAKFAGAAEVVGLDASALYIERARQRFAGVQFLQQSWDVLPPGPFDVILLASALHYARDQADLINRAIAALTPGGTLVLELGVAPGEQNAWVEVERGADRRLFATWAKLTEILGPHAWKLISESVAQKGDPVPRYTLHINRRRPVAYLAMQPPGFGKTTICRELFKPAGVPVVSGDQCLVDISQGRLAVDEALRGVVVTRCTPDSLDKTMLAILSADLLPALVQVWLAQAGGRTFALDCSLPAMYQAQVEQILKAHGYLTVRLEWQRPGAELQASGKVSDMADAFFVELGAPAGALAGAPAPVAPPSAPAMPFTGTLGAVVQLGVNSEVIDVIGWAVHEDGRMPACIAIRLGEHTHIATAYDRAARPQVQSRLGLPHPMFGFKIRMPIPPGIKPVDVLELLQVYGGTDARQLHGPFSKDLLKPREPGKPGAAPRAESSDA